MTAVSIAKHLVPYPLRLRWNVHQALRSGEPELGLLPAMCRPDRISLDIGACRGVYSWLLKKHSARVIAFEPQAYYANFARRALRNVEVLQCVVSDKESEVVLRVPIDEACSGMASVETGILLSDTREIRVQSRRIDDLSLEQVGFMKIDVEGHELAVLRGAVRIIARDRPNLLIEAEERHRAHAVASVRHFLHEQGYVGFFLDNGIVRPMDDFHPERHQNTEALSRPDANRAYINNFMFVQSEGVGALCQIARRGGISARRLAGR